MVLGALPLFRCCVAVARAGLRVYCGAARGRARPAMHPLGAATGSGHADGQDVSQCHEPPCKAPARSSERARLASQRVVGALDFVPTPRG
jgi:hypothetical protein